MNRKLLCYGPFCHPQRIKHDRETMIAYKRQHFCKKCWKYVNEQYQDRLDLYQFIERKAIIRYPTGMMKRDIRKYLTQYHYSYKGIKVALIYANKFSANFDFDGPYFLHYVPYIYEKAQRWQYDKDRHNNVMLNHDDHPNNKIRHATVRIKYFEPKKQLKTYDMSKF